MVRHTFNGYSDIDGTVFKRDFPSSTAPIWNTRSYRQIQEQILPMQQQIQQQIQPQAQPQFHPLIQHQIQQQLKEQVEQQVQPQIQQLLQNIQQPQRGGQPRSYWFANMARNAIAHRQVIFQDRLSGREIKLYNFMTVTTRVNDIDVGSLVNTFEVTMKVDYYFSPYFEGINDLLGPGWAGRRISTTSAAS